MSDEPLQYNTNRKVLKWLHFDDESRVKGSREPASVGPIVLHTCPWSLFNIFRLAMGSTCLDIPTVFYAGSHGRFKGDKVQPQENETWKNESRLFFSLFAKETMYGSQSSLYKKGNPNVLRDYFSLRTGPSIITSIPPVICPVTWNKLSFPSVEINKPIPIPV